MSHPSLPAGAASPRLLVSCEPLSAELMIHPRLLPLPPSWTSPPPYLQCMLLLLCGCCCSCSSPAIAPPRCTCRPRCGLCCCLCGCCRSCSCCSCYRTPPLHLPSLLWPLLLHLNCCWWTILRLLRIVFTRMQCTHHLVSFLVFMGAMSAPSWSVCFLFSWVQSTHHHDLSVLDTQCVVYVVYLCTHHAAPCTGIGCFRLIR